MATNILDNLPNAKKTRMPGLYRIGRNQWVIQTKVDFNGVKAGYQGYYDGDLKSAIQHLKDIRVSLKKRAFDKYKATVLARLQELRVKLFK